MTESLNTATLLSMDSISSHPSSNDPKLPTLLSVGLICYCAFVAVLATGLVCVIVHFVRKFW